MKNGEKKKYWEFKASAKGEGELYIYGEITAWEWDDSDTSANSFKRDLDALGDIRTLRLYINSPGGSVFEGVTIHSILKRHKARVIVHVDALAASVASVIAMAGDEIHMPRNAMMMIHNPWRVTMGNAAEHRKAADDLDRIGGSMKQTYLDRAGDKLDEARLTELLEGETWLSAQECLDYGFCDVIGEENRVAACISEELFSKYKNIPQSLMNKQEQPPENSEKEAELRQQIIEDENSYLNYIESTMGVIRQ